MPKPTTRPARDSRRWRRAAMKNPFCKGNNDKLVLIYLTVAGALLMGLIGSILAFSLPSSGSRPWPPYSTEAAAPEPGQLVSR